MVPVLAALALTLAQAPAAPDAPAEALSFAAALLAEKDTYRAITELKRFGHLAGGARALHADLLVGQLYAQERKVDASRFHLGRVAAASSGEPGTAARLLDLGNVCVTRILAGNCVEQVEALPEDTPGGFRPYLRRYAGVMFSGRQPDEGPAVPELAAATARLAELEAERAHLALKSPLVAGLLSTVLPGAGQLYNGRPVDAALAFGLTGLTAWGSASLLLREKPEWAVGVPLALVALVFYTGNIVNAVGDAHRLNDHAWQAWAAKLQQEAWPKFAVSVGPGGASFVLTVQLGQAPARTVLSSGEEARGPESRARGLDGGGESP